jgi:hypothetical protein
MHPCVFLVIEISGNFPLFPRFYFALQAAMIHLLWHLTLAPLHGYGKKNSNG